MQTLEREELIVCLMKMQSHIRNMSEEEFNRFNKKGDSLMSSYMPIRYDFAEEHARINRRVFTIEVMVRG